MGRKARKRLYLVLAAAAIASVAAGVWVVARGPAASLAGLIGPRAPSRPLINGTLTLREACAASGIAYPPPRPEVRIHKGSRVLTLLSDGDIIKEYSVGLGRKPEGDKEREGDGRTPTGDFYLCTRLRKSRWYRFLGVSYPAPDDARRGRNQGVITSAQHAAIVEAHRERRQPPWNTPLGGEIGIHGGGSGLDWTLGCIALENRAIEELFEALPPGTPVAIR